MTPPSPPENEYRVVTVLVAVALVACGADSSAHAAVAPRSSGDDAQTTSTDSLGAERATAAPIERFDLVVDEPGVVATLASAGFPATAAEELDEAFVGRIDLFARAAPGSRLTLWLRDASLVGARVDDGDGSPLFVARYDGDNAPAGFYDDDGGGMIGTILSRPVALGRITSRFGERFDAFTGERSMHHAIDYGVPVGTPVVALGRGRVVAVGASTSGGSYIKIAYAGGYQSLYLHLSRFARTAKLGATVEQGDVVAFSGNTGRSTGPHLHYELRIAGLPVDPLANLPPPAIALGPLARREHLAFMKQLEEIR